MRHRDMKRQRPRAVIVRAEERPVRVHHASDSNGLGGAFGVQRPKVGRHAER